MTLAEMLENWRQGIREDWDEFLDDVRRAIEKAKSDPHSGYWLVHGGVIYSAALAEPAKLASIAKQLAPVADAVIAERDSEGDPLGIDAVNMSSWANMLACVGASLAPATEATMRAWLPRFEVKRDASVASYFWDAAFAAIALGDRRAYRRFTGVEHTRELSFQPGATFGFNLQGLAAHLAGAIEQNGTRADVSPAYDEVITKFGDHFMADSARPQTLLWIARIVEHRIGKAPLGEVAKRLSARIAELAK